MEGRCALWTGRFQPPSIAHVATAVTILKSWERLEIVVSYEIPPPAHIATEWAAYIQASQRTSFGAGKNPFTPTEVRDMWLAAIRCSQQLSRVTVEISGRPEFDPTFIDRYPANTHDFILVRLAQGDSSIDSIHDDVLPRLHRRPVFHVHPPFKLHNSQIRKNVLENGHPWSAYLPAGTLEVFERIDGPRRIRDASLRSETIS